MRFREMKLLARGYMPQQGKVRVLSLLEVRLMGFHCLTVLCFRGAWLCVLRVQYPTAIHTKIGAETYG